MDDWIGISDAIAMVGKSRQSIYKRPDVERRKKNGKIEFLRSSLAKAFKVGDRDGKNGKVEWSADELFRRDIERADDEEVNRIKKKADAIKSLEQAKKLKLEQGELLKRTSVDETLRNIGEFVRSKAAMIHNGFAGVVKGRSPAEIESLCEKRVNEYLEEVSDGKIDVLESV